MDRIGFVIVRLKHLDYSINSHIICACICSIRSDFAFCTGPGFFSQGREPEVEGQRRRRRRQFVVAGDVKRSAGGGSITTS